MQGGMGGHGRARTTYLRAIGGGALVSDQFATRCKRPEVDMGVRAAGDEPGEGRGAHFEGSAARKRESNADDVCECE